MSFLTKTETGATAVEVPVLCRIWEEQGIFNGVAEDLPVAVFGETYEEARQNLRDAVISHLEALRQLQQLNPVVEHLRRQAREGYFSPQEIPRDQSFYRFSAAIHNSRILPLV
jgi:predicted RNase H-like HicB family nuclease